MSTLQRAGLTGKELVKFAQSVAATLEKSPDQVERERLEFERQRAEQERNSYSIEAEDKYETLNQQLFEMKVENAINRPEVAAIARQFNEKYGEGVSGKGAFIDEVAKEGMLYFQQSGQVGDPSVVVSNVAKKLSAFLQPTLTQAPTSKTPTKTKTIISANKNLPNIDGSSDITPLGKSNMTIAQMEKHFSEELARRR
jgi:hypothetical protein